MITDKAPYMGRMKVGRTGKLRKPGFLKGHVRYFLRRKKSKWYEKHFGIGPLGYAFYGYILVGGHGNARPYDWMTPTWNRMQQQTITTMTKKLGEGILREGEKLGFKKAYGWHFG
jgi:hypothetical protein